MKAVILARVSTLRQEQEGLSLREMQVPKLREYASSKGFEVAQEFVFSESADQKIRTKFLEMIELVKSQREIKYIIAFRVDRITRNFRDAVLIDELMRDHDIELHFVEDRLIINKDTVGRDIQDWDLKVFLGKQYINRLREDAKNSASYKLSNSEWPGRAPWGYKNVTLDRRKKMIEPDGIKAQAVKAMYEWYSTGTYSMLQVREKVKKEFQLELSKGNVDQILKRKFYHGIMEFKGSEHPHKYELLIEPELYVKVQEVKASYGKKSGYKFAGLPYTYRGLITCEHCGAAISPERKKGKYVYYKCTEYYGKHGAKYIREEEITRQLVEACKQITVPQWVIDEITRSLKESLEDKKHYSETLYQEYRKEFDKYQTRLDNMYVDKLDGLISAQDYQTRQEDYRAKQRALKSKIDQLEKADDSYYKAAEAILAVAKQAKDMFEGSEVELQRLFVKLLLRNLRLNGANLVYDWNESFQTIMVHVNRQEWLPGRGSNLRPIG